MKIFAAINVLKKAAIENILMHLGINTFMIFFTKEDKHFLMLWVRFFYDQMILSMKQSR